MSNTIPRFSPTLYKRISDAMDINTVIVDYVVDGIVQAVMFAKGHPSSPTRASQLPEYAPFKLYVSSVLRSLRVRLDTIFVAFVFVDRLKLEDLFKNEELACEKMFISSLMLAKRFTGKLLPQNRKWALYSCIFGKVDIDTLEYDALMALDFELEVEKSDVVLHQEAFAKMALSNSRYYPSRGKARFLPLSVFSYSSPQWEGRPQTKLTPQRWWKRWLSSKPQTVVA
ncbi:hypothetical protein V8B97DRAFT_1954279 [Scleroderma yunnanense]